MLPDQLADIVFGSIFLFIGLSLCSMAAIRGARAMSTLACLGAWSGMYGAVHLGSVPAVVVALPRWMQSSEPFANTALTYLLLVFGALSFAELSLGQLRLLIQSGAAAGLAISIAATARFAVTGSTGRWEFLNNLLALCLLMVLAGVVAVPQWAGRYLAAAGRGVLATGTLAFALEAVFSSVSRNLGLAIPLVADHLGFAVLLGSFGYVALRKILSDERRLLAVGNELAVARQIQTSILPTRMLEVDNLRISAAYQPMSEVAGDFYEFIPVDRKRIGLLVADVSGHGVPAALIASMIKMAAKAVRPCAHRPDSVMRELNRLLSGQLRGQFVSAAYLWLDVKKGEASYSAAGHPPLLRWQGNRLDRIESNGLLLGVMKERDDYPVCTMRISPCDRFLLYTDGVTEPENGAGEAFGEARLEQILRNYQSRPAAELSDRLLSELSSWQPTPAAQQDDITLLVVDVV